MIQSSNIRVMSSALLKIAKILRRDFNELEKIQNSKQNVEKFVFKSIENIKESINIDIIKARPEAKLFFVEDGSQVQQEDFFFFSRSSFRSKKLFAWNKLFCFFDCFDNRR